MAFDPDDETNKEKKPTLDQRKQAAAPDEFRTSLSENEKASIVAKARATVQAEILAAEKEKFLAEQTEALRREAGVSKKTLGGIHDELVKITVDLSDDDGTADPFIQLDMPQGAKYYHGVTYELPRHIANTLNDIMFRGKLSSMNRAGKSVFRNRTYGTVLGEHGARHTGIQETRIH